ncbi:MAG: Adaptive-response sensory-kinase SasA [Phycisphaerae bacterium]|nr:Adaptive-response sensory-kinase SasA [Phycisphaerae bacterium]
MTVEKTVTTTNPGATTTVASSSRFSDSPGAIAWFGLVTVAIVLAAAIGASFASHAVIRMREADRSAQSAPALMNVLSDAVRARLDASQVEIQRMLGDLSRVPGVEACRLTIRGTGGEATHGAAGARGATGRYLRAELVGESGGRTALLEVWFSADGGVSAMASTLSAGGMVGAGALLVFGLSFAAFRRAVRPITLIRKNLLDYQRGQETTLGLLALRQADNTAASAWNGLLSSIEEMQRELDVARCRQIVSDVARTRQLCSSQDILDALPIGVVELRGEAEVSYWNYSAGRMLGLSAESGKDGKSGSVSLSDPGLLSAIERLRAAFAPDGQLAGDTLNHVDHEIRAPGTDGTPGELLSVIRLTPIAGGEQRGDFVLMVQDVSQLIDAERSRDSFIAHITHELRTPLTNIRAYAETLNEDLFDDEKTRRECYNVIMSETQRLTRLVEGVLSVSAIEAGASKFERAPVKLDHSLRQAVQDVQANADARSIDLALRLPSKVPLVMGDRHRLHQVWINLLGNAIKYTPAKGSVSVTLQSDERVVRVCVCDTGIGIAPEHHRNIFEKFYRVEDPTVEGIEGTGLGLAITKDIVRMHGGTIGVESEMGRGSTFFVELPRARESVGAAAGEAVHGANRHR